MSSKPEDTGGLTKEEIEAISFWKELIDERISRQIEEDKNKVTDQIRIGSYYYTDKVLNELIKIYKNSGWEKVSIKMSYWRNRFIVFEFSKKKKVVKKKKTKQFTREDGSLDLRQLKRLKERGVIDKETRHFIIDMIAKGLVHHKTIEALKKHEIV